MRRRLLTEDIHWEHHNRFQGAEKKPLLASIREIHAKLPDRRFGSVTCWAQNGDIIYPEHDWTATPVVTELAWGWEEGVATSMECVSVFVLEPVASRSGATTAEGAAPTAITERVARRRSRSPTAAAGSHLRGPSCAA